MNLLSKVQDDRNTLESPNAPMKQSIATQSKKSVVLH